MWSFIRSGASKGSKFRNFKDFIISGSDGGGRGGGWYKYVTMRTCPETSDKCQSKKQAHFLWGLFLNLERGGNVDGF